jgi:hypothetical protein
MSGTSQLLHMGFMGFIFNKYLSRFLLKSLAIMAHEILPQHRPHEQLRTEAPVQRNHSDKYVSAYVSSDNHVDMSFQNPILQDSADHFLVGIDDLTVNLSNLSMIEYDASGSNVLLRIRRLLTEDEGIVNDLAFADFMHTPALQAACEFRITRPYHSLAEILERIWEMLTTINNFINTGGLDNTGLVTERWNVEAGVVAPPVAHIQVYLTNGGLLRFTGNQLFWSNFCIEIPDLKYRQLMLGSDIQFISLHPEGGNEREPFDIDDGEINANEFIPALVANNILASLTSDLRSFTGGMNILYSLDRRVALEVGCSLPLKNSPMVDHGQEAPDFVLGRFNLTSQKDMSSMPMDGHAHFDFKMGARQLQRPSDRICYHHLGPQQKIQAMRLRLWARVRTYNATQRKWGMQTIMYPVMDSDFWHIKLHFIRKDSKR